MNNSLAGLRLVEGSAFVAAPFAGMTLAQQGVDVIRFDPIGGGLDYHRWPVTDDGDSLYWASLNKGKRSIAVDLRSEEGRELVVRLITASGADGGLFLTNFPAVGWLDYRELKKRRSDLIMLNIMGNSDGTSEVDYTVNCATGLPFMTGPSEHPGPVNHVLPAWDLLTGLTAVNGLLTAERHRRLTGEGQLIKLALSDVAFATMGNLGFISEYQINGTERGSTSNDLYGAFGRDFATSDGRRVMIAAISPRQWQALVKAMGIADEVKRIEDAEGVDLNQQGDRYRAREAIARLLAPWCAARSMSEVADALNLARVSWGPYQTVRQMLEEDRRCSAANPMFAEVEQPGIGRHLMPGSPLEFAAAGRHSARPAPLLGQHTDEILYDLLDLSDVQIGRLHDRGLVAGPTPKE